MFEYRWNDPMQNPQYCGYCKSEPCQCDGHGNYAEDHLDVEEMVIGEEEEAIEEEYDEEEAIEEDYESPREPRKLRAPLPERNPRPQRPSHVR